MSSDNNMVILEAANYAAFYFYDIKFLSNTMTRTWYHSRYDLIGSRAASACDFTV